MDTGNPQPGPPDVHSRARRCPQDHPQSHPQACPALRTGLIPSAPSVNKVFVKLRIVNRLCNQGRDVKLSTGSVADKHGLSRQCRHNWNGMGRCPAGVIPVVHNCLWMTCALIDQSLAILSTWAVDDLCIALAAYTAMRVSNLLRKVEKYVLTLRTLLCVVNRRCASAW
jgi:hypothetical protein